MIWVNLFDLVRILLVFIMRLVPQITIVQDINGLLGIISYAAVFLPVDAIITVLTGMMIFYTAWVIIAVVRFAAKK